MNKLTFIPMWYEIDIKKKNSKIFIIGICIIGIINLILLYLNYNVYVENKSKQESNMKVARLSKEENERESNEIEKEAKKEVLTLKNLNKFIDDFPKCQGVWFNTLDFEGNMIKVGARTNNSNGYLDTLEKIENLEAYNLKSISEPKKEKNDYSFTVLLEAKGR